MNALKYAFYQRLMNLAHDIYRRDGAALHDAMRAIRNEITFGHLGNDIRHQFGDFYPGDLMASDAFCGMIGTIGIFDIKATREAISDIWGQNWPSGLVDYYGKGE